MPEVTVLIINYNHGKRLAQCLDGVGAQLFRDFELVVFDNDSTDGSLALALDHPSQPRVIRSPRNVGFARAVNLGIRSSEAPFMLLLNPDALLTPPYLGRLVAAARSDPAVGSLTGKLLRWEGNAPSNVVDSTGHILLRNRWALDRGEAEVDQGQYDAPGEVFGVCGAAALYRRAMLEDIRVGDEYFSETFFAYLDDVDVGWRARLRGWTAQYVPDAVAYHERGHRGRPWMRNAFILRHSLKNRYLMMLRNDRLADVARDFPAIAGMEVLRFVDYLLTQPRALGGYVDVVRLLPRVLRERREIQRRRTVPPSDIRGWLHRYPYRRKLREKLLRRIAPL
jgi:GT2 family glycosyltransferase